MINGKLIAAVTRRIIAGLMNDGTVCPVIRSVPFQPLRAELDPLAPAGCERFFSRERPRVCFEVQTGKHLLGLNLTAFDPKQTVLIWINDCCAAPYSSGG
jgi:hypothetical protein